MNRILKFISISLRMQSKFAVCKKKICNFVNLKTSLQLFLSTSPKYKANPGKLEKMSVRACLFLFKTRVKERENFGQRAERNIKGDELFSTPRC